MGAMFEVIEKQCGRQPAVIKIVGVGSGGVNAVNTMIAQKVCGVEYIAMNTDIQSLEQSAAETVIELNGTKGRGAGGDPGKGRESAIQERHRIAAALKGAHMVIVATGLGGGTGTGASPVVADLAKAAGILTVAVVTLPFSWEGDEKMRIALEGLEAMKKAVDAYVIIPNDKMMKVAPQGLSMRKSIQLIDQVLCASVGGGVDLITRPGYINRDFEDVRAVLANCGLCVMGTGVGEGPERALQAVTAALNNPLLEETPVDGARSVLVNIVQSDDGMPQENALVMAKVKECIAVGGRISFGLAFDDKLGDKVKVSIIASGMDDIEVVDPRAAIDVPPPGNVRAMPVDVRGVQPPARPVLIDQQDPFERMQPQRRQLNVGTPGSLLFNSAEGESELDPTPAYLRVGASVEARGSSSGSPAWGAPGYGSGRDGGQKL
ncbi:MAG: cell division protein FtsZ [Deltaproteobacteria bacterium]|nr:cell division protein FtsZ [Deltaproteobacteria bacterium]